MKNKISLVSTIFLFLLLILTTYFVNKQIKGVSQKSSKTLAKKDEVLDLSHQEININQKEYQVSWVEIENMEKLSLHSNLQNPVSSRKAKEALGCRLITSAGFYTKEDTHLGLFVEDGKTLSDAKKSKLLNGFVYMKKNDLHISDYPPQDITYGLQSGPLIIYETKGVNTQAANSENARRILAATTKDNKLILMTIYDPASPVDGPKILELKTILKKFEEKNKIQIKSALNLDGGSASLFAGDGTSLREVAKSGGFFCLK